MAKKGGSPVWIRSRSGSGTAFALFFLLEVVAAFIFLLVMFARITQPDPDEFPLWVHVGWFLPGIIIGAIVFLITGLEKAQTYRTNRGSSWDIEWSERSVDIQKLSPSPAMGVSLYNEDNSFFASYSIIKLSRKNKRKFF